MERAGRHVLLVSGVVAACVVVATVLILALGSPTRAEWEPGTPEATLQTYVDAVWSGDSTLALSLLTEKARKDHEENYSGSPFLNCGSEAGSMLVVERVTRSADDTQATVIVRVESFGGSGISWDRSSWTRDVALVREAGEWRIADAYLCL